MAGILRLGFSSSVRAISSKSRISYAFINKAAALSTDKPTVVCERPRYFSTEHDSGKSSSITRKVVEAIQSEIKAHELNMSRDRGVPPNLPFTIEDDPKFCHIMLRRDYEKEKIEVTVNPVHDERVNLQGEDEEDGSSSDSGSGSSDSDDGSSSDSDSSDSDDDDDGSSSDSGSSDSDDDDGSSSDDSASSDSDDDRSSSDSGSSDSDDDDESSSDSGSSDSDDDGSSSDSGSSDSDDGSSSDSTDSDDSDDDGSNNTPSESVVINVSIIQEKKGTIDIGANVTADKIVVTRMSFTEPDQLESSARYYVEAEGELQDALCMFVEKRGIKSANVGFLYNYMIEKRKDWGTVWTPGRKPTADDLKNLKKYFQEW